MTAPEPSRPTAAAAGAAAFRAGEEEPRRVVASHRAEGGAAMPLYRRRGARLGFARCGAYLPRRCRPSPTFSTG